MNDRLAIVEAFARGLTQGLLSDLGAVLAVTNHPVATPPPKEGLRDGSSPLPEAPSIIPGEIPQPGFDQVEEPTLPGFEGIPPVTLLKMQEAIDRITKGDAPAPGYYNPDDADVSVPLS